MTFLRSCLVALCLLLAVSPAQAAAIDKDGAAKLKVVVTNFLKEQKKLAKIDGLTKVEYQGETMVEEAGDYYAVTMPYTKIIQPDGNQVDVGMISVNASPGDAPGQWKMRVAIPTPIVVTNKAGVEIVRMTLGGQRAAGIWDESMQSFVKLDALYKDIAFTGPGATIKIPETRIIYDFAVDTARKWSGPGSITFKNLAADIPKTNSQFGASEIKVSFAIDQYSAAALSEYRGKLAALSETMNKDAAAKAAQPSQDHTAAIANMMMDFFTRAGNGMKVRYDATNVYFNGPSGQAGAVRKIEMPKAFFGIDLSGFTTGKLRFALQSGYEGLKITPPENDGKLTPSTANFDVAIENIPIREIFELGKNTMDSIARSPETKQLAGMSFLIKLQALLSQSGAFLNVTDTHFGNKDIDVKLEGRARADMSAVMSGTAEAKATIRNLDTLLAGLKEKEKTMQGKDLEKMQQTIAQLQNFKQNAKEEKTADGQAVHVLEFAVTPQGQVLLNGEDMMKPKAGVQKPAPIPAP